MPTTQTKNRIHCQGLGLLLLALATAGGCSKQEVSPSLPGIDAPEQMTLYSIDGRLPPSEVSEHGEERLYGFPVLGKVEITDAAARKEIATAVKESLSDDQSLMASCFWPRHVLRTVEQGRTFDFVICFQCTQFEYHPDSLPEHKTQAISTKPRGLLNKYLQDAGIPLAPGGLED